MGSTARTGCILAGQPEPGALRNWQEQPARACKTNPSRTIAASMLRPQNAAEAHHEQGTPTYISRQPNYDRHPLSLLRGRKEFKGMIVRGDHGEWRMCVRCGHLTMPANPSFKCPCAKCVKLTSVLLQRSRPRPSRHY